VDNLRAVGLRILWPVVKLILLRWLSPNPQFLQPLEVREMEGEEYNLKQVAFKVMRVNLMRG
jgi:hypothetical protein